MQQHAFVNTRIYKKQRVKIRQHYRVPYGSRTTLHYCFYLQMTSHIEHRVLPEATTRQREKPQQRQNHPEGQQGEHIEKGVQTQEEAKRHQLTKENGER